MNTKINFQFVPGYYEWHLTDEKGNVLHNMCDPVDALFDEGGEPLDFDSVKDLCLDELRCAEEHYCDGGEYNGIRLEESLDDSQMIAAAKIMATALYNYYIA